MHPRLRSVPALFGTVLAAIGTLVATMLAVDHWGVPVAGMLLTVALGILALHALQRERSVVRLVDEQASQRDRVELELRAAELRHRLLADNATDTIPPSAFVATACVIDCAAEAARDADFLLTADHLRAWEGKHGPIPPPPWK